jgi:hypothetical protein
MSPIEEDLHRLFADPPHAPAPWPDATTRVRAGMRRRHRRRVAGAAGSVTLALLVVIAVAVAWVRPPAGPPPIVPAPTPSAVPWLDHDPVSYPRPTLDPRTPTKSCAAADLALSPLAPNGAGGTQVYTVEVRNTGQARCTLSGTPTLRYTDASGATRTATTVQLSQRLTDPNSVPATIDPGEAAQLEMDTSNSCLHGQPPILYADARLALADGGELKLGQTLDATCGPPAMGGWSRPARPGTLANPGWDVLTVTLELPESARIGQTLEYVVVLDNPSGVPVALSPCPNYVQWIGDLKTGGMFQLNCAVSVVPAHGAVRFEMRAPIPDDTTDAGPQKLTWRLETDAAGTAPTAEGLVTLIH